MSPRVSVIASAVIYSIPLRRPPHSTPSARLIRRSIAKDGLRSPLSICEMPDCEILSFRARDDWLWPMISRAFAMLVPMVVSFIRYSYSGITQYLSRGGVENTNAGNPFGLAGVVSFREWGWQRSSFPWALLAVFSLSPFRAENLGTEIEGGVSCLLDLPHFPLHGVWANDAKVYFRCQGQT